jgi:fructokinase
MNFNVVGVGEILWDLLEGGPQLGGAPANFAYHAHALGAHAQVITRVGDDDLGREIIRRFQGMHLPTSAVQVDSRAPTGTAKVSLSGDGLAHFVIEENVAWDYLAATPEALAAARQADAICFGSLAQRSGRSRSAIQELVAATPDHALRVFDINLRQHYYSREVIEQSLRLANVLKLNEDEVPVLAEMFGSSSSDGGARSGADGLLGAESCDDANMRTGVSAPHVSWPHVSAPQIYDQVDGLARRFDLQVVALTRGAAGSFLYQRRDGVVRWSDCACRPVEVVDTVGAGDSFTAALVLGLLKEMDLDEINGLANEVARYVCSRSGATPPMPAEFAEKFGMRTVRRDGSDPGSVDPR